MKISRDTRQRIDNIKSDANMARTQLRTLLARLDEHYGTKRMSRELERIINRLENWQQN